MSITQSKGPLFTCNDIHVSHLYIIATFCFGLNAPIADLNVLVCTTARITKHNVVGMEIALGLSVTCASKKFTGI